MAPAHHVNNLKLLVEKGVDIRSGKYSSILNTLIGNIKGIPSKVKAGTFDLYSTIKDVRTLADLLNYLISQGKLNKEELSKFTPIVYRVVVNKALEPYKKLQYELLTLPIKSLLPDFLKEKLTELCEGKN